jgi:hypothetical protein
MPISAFRAYNQAAKREHLMKIGINRCEGGLEKASPPLMLQARQKSRSAKFAEHRKNDLYGSNNCQLQQQHKAGDVGGSGEFES